MSKSDGISISKITIDLYDKINFLETSVTIAKKYLAILILQGNITLIARRSCSVPISTLFEFQSNFIENTLFQLFLLTRHLPRANDALAKENE